MTIEADVAVIGAGLGGLSVAVSLAQEGLKVVLFEHHAVPGGYAHEFRRGRFRFDVSLHAIDGVGPGGMCYEKLGELGVLDRIRFKKLDPFYVTRFPGREIVAHADVDAYRDELIRHFPEEAPGISSAFAEMVLVYRETRLAQELQPHQGQLSPVDFAVRCPHLRRALQESLQQFWDRHIRSVELKAVLSTLWGYFGLPPSRLNAAPFLISWGSYHLIGGFYPEGGSFAISRALEARLKELGGEVYYRQTVTRVHVRDGRAAGVSSHSGLEVSARAVVSNANLPDTMLKMVDAECLPARYHERIRRKRSSISSLCIYLGLSHVPEALAQFPHHLWIAEDYDLERQYAAVVAGEWGQVPLALTNYREADPHCAPPGGAVVNITALAPWQYEDVWGTGGELTNYQQNPRYLAIKERVAKRLLARLERYFPGLNASIKYYEVATPLTNMRYSLNRDGAIYGFEQSVEGYLNRFSQQTPIPGLFLAGSWGNAGGGQSAALSSGRSAAKLVLSALNA